jgi:hypothetical protein
MTLEMKMKEERKGGVKMGIRQVLPENAGT